MSFETRISPISKQEPPPFLFFEVTGRERMYPLKRPTSHIYDLTIRSPSGGTSSPIPLYPSMPPPIPDNENFNKPDATPGPFKI
jgi:hypothetical protein